MVRPENPEPSPEAIEQRREPEPDGGEGELLRDVAARFIVYVSPEFHKAVIQYAVSQSGFRTKVKPHDICVQALEEWARTHGITAPVRAKETAPPKKRLRR